MLKRIDHTKMGSSDLGWLKSKFHFSFADYYNPSNLNFGTLRVINDDLVEAGTGFDTHPHRDMEIVSYVVNGELTHGDSMGNKRTLSRGHVQYMSAGTGVLHSEHNFGEELLRFLQIWIIPNKKGYEPNYGDYLFDWNDRKNKWLHIVSSKEGDAPIKINQDSNLFALELDKDQEIDFKVGKDRQAYLVQIEGSSDINSIVLNMQDALEITEEDIKIKALETSHFLVVEMKK
ncbi:Pirin-related protein [Desulfitobacterium dehalogenans ATCC 51507]|uniref:Pirin-related protein n=1 Tax=Desulfitobacterium dehalogenans (strain ATCC 51507 / DSM 9161 / JW/IU-DC1) TaxID=756499 RepID=I4A7L5_DESDJ|nr:pirin family protein [Desulfitobacterium dehalogenans]AFL99949.1 Pirin-related protein [Desulfitobacterium dehalogenans ATCC 51507]